jgi:hypothetical protein
MNLTKRVGLKILKRMGEKMRRERLVRSLESRLDEAIEAGDLDRVLEISFLLRRV